MRTLLGLALVLLSACQTDIPREGARCDVDKYDYVCDKGALWQCRPRTRVWLLESHCSGPAGCTIARPPGVVPTPSCDAREGDLCGVGRFVPICAADRTAQLSCIDGKITGTACPVGCKDGMCQSPAVK